MLRVLLRYAWVLASCTFFFFLPKPSNISEKPKSTKDFQGTCENENVEPNEGVQSTKLVAGFLLELAQSQAQLQPLTTEASQTFMLGPTCSASAVPPNGPAASRFIHRELVVDIGMAEMKKNCTGTKSMKDDRSE